MKYKIMPVYMIEADNPQDVIFRFGSAQKAGTLDDYFETYIVKKVEEQPAKGWIAKTVEQVTGK